MSWNNTYGIKGINETTKHWQLWELSRPGGVQDQLDKCVRLAKALEDPEDQTAVDPVYVEQYCKNASTFNSEVLVDPLMKAGKYGWFDITHSGIDPFPWNYHLGWLNEHWVQKALGVPVNFTWVSYAVSSGFNAHGDMPRGGYLEDLADLLDHGVKVALVYGDRDFACNWIGGEAASLAIPHRHRKDFAAAGYAPLTLNGPETPPFVPYGLTRQHGNLSFTRVFQAGHMVPSYQPEASLRIFERALFNKDIATGAVDLTATGGWTEGAEVFTTDGPRDTWWKKSEVLPSPKGLCYILQLGTCTKEEVEALRNGTAIVKDYVLVDINGDGGESTVESGDTKGKGHVQGDKLQAIVGVDEL